KTERRGPFDVVPGRHLEVLDPVPASPEVTTAARVERPVDPLPHRQRLIDGGVADGVDGDLQASEVGVVEELGQLVRIDRQGSGVLAALVWSGDRRGARADRAVDRQVAADRL